MNRLSGFFRRMPWHRDRAHGLLDDNGGTVAVITAIAFMLLMVCLGGAVDGMRYYIMRNELRVLADAAAIAAGANPLNNDQVKLEADARKYLNANADNDTVGDWTVTSSYETEEQKFRLTLDSSIPAYLLRVLPNKERLYATASAEVLRTLPGPLEIAMALDVTPSMAGGVSPASPCPTPSEDGTIENVNTKLAALRCAVRTLISELSVFVTSTTREKMKIGVVPFDVYANVGEERFRNASFISWPTGNRRNWRGCVGYRAQGLRATIDNPVANKYGFSDVPSFCLVSELVPLREIYSEGNRATLLNAISRTTSGTGSLLNAGLIWAWQLLDPDITNPIYTEARSKAEMRRLKGRKILILFSDGWNNQGPMFAGPNSWLMPGSYVPPAKTDMGLMCSNIKNAGIEIYVVAFDNNNAEELARLSACASPGAQYFIRASSAQQLIQAFRNIAVSFRPVRLTD